jgi:hypothetical protein
VRIDIEERAGFVGVVGRHRVESARRKEKHGASLRTGRAKRLYHSEMLGRRTLLRSFRGFNAE